MSHDPEQPELDLRDIENQLTAVERAIADPAARNSTFAHGVVLQASWLLSALGRWDTAAAAAELAQACWWKVRVADPSPYIGGLFWAGHCAAAVAHMGAEDWDTAKRYIINVLRDFSEESQALYLYELCQQAQGRRAWKDELDAFDVRRYALKQYEDRRVARVRAALDEPDIDGPEDGQPAVSARWRGVPIPPDLFGDDWTTADVLTEPDPTIRSCAIAKIGPERYAREAEAITGHPVPPDDDPDQACHT